jgi:hypothetical protein
MRSTSAYIALLVATRLGSQAGALSLDVANAAAGVALLSCDGARRWASIRLMAGLAAVVAQPLVRSAVLGNVAHWTGWTASAHGHPIQTLITHSCHI